MGLATDPAATVTAPEAPEVVAMATAREGIAIAITATAATIVVAEIILAGRIETREILAMLTLPREALVAAMIVPATEIPTTITPIRRVVAAA